jgi:hypothetical protein
MAIFIAIDYAELEPFRDFGSEADFSRPIESESILILT